MTSLLRHSGSDVTPISWRSDAPGSAPVDPALQALQDEVTALRAAVSAAEHNGKEAVAAAYERGRRDAEATFKQDESQRMALLRDGIVEAAKDAKARFADLERLSLVLCETALANIFADISDFRDLTTRAIRRQLSTLRRESVLRINISPLDFPDEAALDALRAQLTPASDIEISQAANLVAGACRIDLRLGHVELSVPDFWHEVSTKLRAMAEEAAP